MFEGIHEEGKTKWQPQKGGWASQKDKTKLEQNIGGEGLDPTRTQNDQIKPLMETDDRKERMAHPERLR